MRRAVFFFIVVLFCCHGHPIAQTAHQPDSGGIPVRVTQLRPERFGPFWSTVSSCLSTPARIVIRDREVWDKQWKQMWAGPACGYSFSREADGTIVPTTVPAPDVDFSREMIIVAALGMRPTGGYAITVDTAYERGDKLEVIVRSISPGSCFLFTTDPQFGIPTDIVRIAKSERPIVFREIKAAMDCKSVNLSRFATSLESSSLKSNH
jgi:hypothetical protein